MFNSWYLTLNSWKVVQVGRQKSQLHLHNLSSYFSLLTAFINCWYFASSFLCLSYPLTPPNHPAIGFPLFSFHLFPSFLILGQLDVPAVKAAETYKLMCFLKRALLITLESLPRPQSNVLKQTAMPYLQSTDPTTLPQLHKLPWNHPPTTLLLLNVPHKKTGPSQDRLNRLYSCCSFSWWLNYWFVPAKQITSVFLMQCQNVGSTAASCWEKSFLKSEGWSKTDRCKSMDPMTTAKT